MKNKSNKCTHKMTKHVFIPYSDYYFKALDSIPKDHTNRDEIVNLLIDQVIDDADYAYTSTDRRTDPT